MLKRALISIMTAILLVNSIFSAETKARVNTSAILELKDKVWVGAGQAGMTGFDGFENYWNIAPDNLKPNVFMDYYDTWNMNEKWAYELKEELLKFHRGTITGGKSYYVIPQIGVNIFYLWQAYLDGSQDDELDNMVKGFKYLAMPAFLRIGYEFNNPPPQLATYNTEHFKEIFEIFAKKIKDAGLEVACVWNISLSPSTSYWSPYNLDYNTTFPDPKYIDWIGFNTFCTDFNTNHQLIQLCLGKSRELGKPVLIGEASINWPLNTINNKDSDYGRFCGPFINWVKQASEVKQTTYINWDWDGQDMVGGNGLFPWGDARLQTAGSGYRSNFFKDMDDGAFFHAADEATTRKNLMITHLTKDNQAPSKVVNLRRDENVLKWDPVDEKGGSKLAHYTIYRDGKLWDYTIDPEYEVKSLSWGNNVDVTVTAMDRAGNESEVSASLNVRRVAGVEKIWDGDFNYPPTSQAVDWRWMGSMDGGAKGPPDDCRIDTTGKLDGKYCALLHDYDISSGSNPGNYWRKMTDNPQDYKLQFFQCFQVKKGEKYKISFQAMAKEPRTIRLYFMDNHISPDHKFLPCINGNPQWDTNGDWQFYKIWDVEIGTEAKTYKYECTAPETETARLSFMMGKVEPTTIWIDKVSCWEGDGANSIQDPYKNYNSLNNLKLNVVNLSNKNIAKVTYDLAGKSKVSLNVFNCAGKLINSYVNDVQAKGKHTYTIKTDKLSSGVYYVKLNACGGVNIKNMMVVR